MMEKKISTMLSAIILVMAMLFLKIIEIEKYASWMHMMSAIKHMAMNMIG